jgi:peptidoglycan hydrolase-like amidase
VRATHPAYIGMTRAYVRVAAGIVQALDWEMIPTTPDEAAQAVIEEKLRAQRQEQPEATPQAGWLLAEAFVAISEPPATLRVLMPDGTVQVMVMEEYLRGVVPAEMPASWPLEALRAQAVAARSYASTRRAHRNVGADVCTTTHCQVWRAVYYDRTDQAVRETRGVVGRYDGLIIEAYYFAHCDGRTRNSEEVWIRALPYCRSVLCPCGNTRMRGHGVGMCQHGARTMALRGRDYRQILTHYYTGISVSLPPTLDRRVYLPLVMGP